MSVRGRSDPTKFRHRTVLIQCPCSGIMADKIISSEAKAALSRGLFVAIPTDHTPMGRGSGIASFYGRSGISPLTPLRDVTSAKRI